MVFSLSGSRAFAPSAVPARTAGPARSPIAAIGRLPAKLSTAAPGRGYFFGSSGRGTASSIEIAAGSM
jgi:hypothetical protein